MSHQTKTKGDYQVSVLQLEDEVNHKVYADWGIGKVTRVSEDNTYAVVWEGDFSACHHEGRELIPAPGGDTESPVLGEEETMERLYNVEQSVHDAGGNLGLISSYEERDNGIFYRVLWEDGKETLNIQSVLQPVHETKAPTPKEVREVVEAKEPEPSYAPIDIIEAWDLNYSLGSVVQLVLLAGGTTTEKEIEDLKLAANLLKRRIDKLEAGK